MTPVDFPEANKTFDPPPDMTEAQVRPIRAYVGETTAGSCDGVRLVVTAWRPDERELAALNAGAPVFLSFLGGLPPHFATVNFAEATNPT